MSFIRLDHLRKTFGANTVVHDFDLGIERGAFLSLLGPSGCGKTTALRMLAGFEKASAGRILIDGTDVTDLPPAKRNVGMVFQAYALFPNMTVAENIAFGLKVAGKPASGIAGRVTEMLALIKLPDLGKRYPYQLSGGQQQRVALARALAVHPQVLLLDEPLSALDAKIRVSLREEIRAVQRALGITTVFVTHDQEEALSISDTIVVMNDGRVEQVGTPFDIYNRPKSRFVANFVGTLSTFNARIAESGKDILLLDGQPVIAPDLAARPAGTTLGIALRPEAFSLGESGPNRLSGTIGEVTFLGSIVRLRIQLAEQTFSMDTFNQPSQRPPAVGDKISVSFAPTDMLLLE
ncbi:MAG: ABC transporter ATP-binding protein [Proteobacteria bacterium]|nr:ABC transporter ATP-binding protein [Pseudomonadota bacterium]